MSKTKLAEIVDFIHRRFTCHGTEMWENGNCYYFARILKDRFPYLEIYYVPAPGHFVAGTGKNFFDIHGEVKVDKTTAKRFKDIQKDDWPWFYRIWRDCVR